MKIKNIFLYFLTITFSSIFILVFTINNKTSTLQTISKITPMGAISILVTNAQTKQKIENATICILETHSYYQTDKNGTTELISLPAEQEQSLPITIKQKCKYYTIMVYKNGFNEHIVFDVKIEQNQNKVGYSIPLVPIINEEDRMPTISYEPQNSATINRLIREYKK